MQAVVMNVNERKHSSASPRANQPIADGHFVHSGMDFVAANVSSSILKTLLYGKIVS